MNQLDGICCFVGNGYYSIFFAGVLEASGGPFGLVASHSFGECPSQAPSVTPTSVTADDSLEELPPPPQDSMKRHATTIDRLIRFFIRLCLMVH